MDQSTHDVRRTNWFNIITECQQRPVGVSVRQWLSDNGIKEKAYYYWQRKFRREACEKIQLPAVTAQAEVSFAEFHVPEPIPEKLTAADHEVKNDVIYQMQDRLDKLEHDYENLMEQVKLASQCVLDVIRKNWMRLQDRSLSSTKRKRALTNRYRNRPLMRLLITL